MNGRRARERRRVAVLADTGSSEARIVASGSGECPLCASELTIRRADGSPFDGTYEDVANQPGLYFATLAHDDGCPVLAEAAEEER